MKRKLSLKQILQDHRNLRKAGMNPKDAAKIVARKCREAKLAQ